MQDQSKFGACQDCGQAVSRLAHTCPKCGRPFGKGAPVSVEAFNMPFFDLVGFMVKAALAAIPAALMLIAVWSVSAIVIADMLRR